MTPEQIVMRLEEIRTHAKIKAEAQMLHREMWLHVVRSVEDAIEDLLGERPGETARSFAEHYWPDVKS